MLAWAPSFQGSEPPTEPGRFRLQLDNQQGLAGSGRRPGAVVRLCLAHGVTPVFIPFAEPWRNGIVEHYNDTFDKSFFRTERFTDPDRLAARYAEFTTFHNARHRYSALGGLTPDQAQARAGFTPTPPDPDVTLPHGFDGLTGTVEYVRLIRSDAKLRVLDHHFDLPDEVVYSYVVAVLDIAAEALTVHYHGVAVTTFPFPLR
ncbi:MAG: transposase [Actinobacteria bacterium]|nr:transposase [Actinomycetota bacterium]